MEQFLRVWSIIVTALFMILCATGLSDKNKSVARGALMILIFMAPVFYYIIKF